MRSFFFPGRPFGSGEQPWPTALFEAQIDPDPLFDPVDEELSLQGPGGGGEGPQGAPAAPGPPPLPRRRKKRLRPPLAALCAVAGAAAVLACGDPEAASPHAQDAVLVQLRDARSTLAHRAPAEEGPPIVPLLSVGAEEAPPLLEVPVPPGRTPREFIQDLSREESVLFAEPVYLYSPQRVPNDPRYRELWGLAKIQAPEAWNKTVGDRSVTVAVVDNGVALDHPDLAPNLWVNPEEVAGNGKDDDGDGYVDDVHGWNFVEGNADPSPAQTGAERFHGSHVSGTIGASGDNHVGVAGVNWKVSLMALRAIGPQGGRADHLARAIDYAADHGARVINASWGGGGQSRTVEAAIARAARHGVLFAAAAGNDGMARPSFPANLALDNLLSVGATGPEDALAAFSNRAAHVAAPGVGILSTTAPGKYERYDGTSMATPHVAGLAALLWAAEPEATLGQVREAILASGVSVEGVARGRIDAARALAALVESRGRRPGRGGLVLSRSALGFKGGDGPARAQTISVRREGGGRTSWKASADEAWISLGKSSGTTPARLSIRVSGRGLGTGTHQGHVRVVSADGGPPAILTITFAVGGAERLVAHGSACALRSGKLRVAAGSICTLAAPGLDLDAAAASVAWSLPGGAVATGARLHARFVRRGEYSIAARGPEGEVDELAVSIE